MGRGLALPRPSPPGDPEGSSSIAQGWVASVLPAFGIRASPLLLLSRLRDPPPETDHSPDVVRAVGLREHLLSRAGVGGQKEGQLLTVLCALGGGTGEQGWEAGRSPRVAAPQAARMAALPSAPLLTALPPSLQSTTKKIDVIKGLFVACRHSEARFIAR